MTDLLTLCCSLERRNMLVHTCSSTLSLYPPLSTVNLLVTTAILPLVLIETVQAEAEVSHGAVASSYQ